MCTTTYSTIFVLIWTTRQYTTRKDKNTLKQELKKSRKLYKNNKYYTRKKVKSFKSKPSHHVKNAKKIYNIKDVKVNKELAKKTDCSLESLKKIVSKGKGAYFSVGARPNQTHPTPNQHADT
jgi:Fic family protein